MFSVIWNSVIKSWLINADTGNDCMISKKRRNSPKLAMMSFTMVIIIILIQQWRKFRYLARRQRAERLRQFRPQQQELVNSVLNLCKLFNDNRPQPLPPLPTQSPILPKKEKGLYLCTYPGCNKNYKTKIKCQEHISSIHEHKI